MLLFTLQLCSFMAFYIFSEYTVVQGRLALAR